ncbi:MAG TPA: hypothetical protein VM848_13765 [Acidimicrobiia bacterium]|nr:hypothetical protein [Acidimicrobiia bacterium]
MADTTRACLIIADIGVTLPRGFVVTSTHLAELLRQALDSSEAEPEPDLPAVDEGRRLASAVD